MTGLDDTERRALLRVFAQEAADHIEALEGLLLGIEEDPSAPELLHRFMRAAHTVKGSAGIVGLAAMSELAHSIETVVQSFRDGYLAASPEMFDILSQAIVLIGESLSDIAVGGAEPAVIAQMSRVIEDWLLEGANRPQASGPIATPTSARTLALGEYDQIRIKVLRSQGKSLYTVRLPVQLEGAEPEAWIVRVNRGLRAAGVVVATEPAATEHQKLRDATELTALVGSDLDPDELRRCINESLDTISEVSLYEPEATDAPAAEDEPLQAPLVSERTVRVELRELHEILRLVGELMICRDRFQLVAQGIASALGDPDLGGETAESAQRLGTLAAELQDAIMRARMVPVARALRHVNRELRRIARETGVPIPLVVSGEQTELDKNLVDALAEPLAAFCGGLAQAQSGASVRGTGLVIHAERRWNRVVIRIEVACGARPATEEQTTLETAIGLAGGRLQHRQIRGEVDHYTISLPLTLAIIRVMVNAVGGEIYAFPIEAVDETLRLEADEISHVQGTQVVELRGEVLSLLFLREHFSVPGPGAFGAGHVIVVSDGDRRVGIVVDQLLGIREVVIKPLSSRFTRLRSLSGSAVLGGDQIALILNADVLVREAIAQADRGSGHRRIPAATRQTA